MKWLLSFMIGITCAAVALMIMNPREWVVQTTFSTGQAMILGRPALKYQCEQSVARWNWEAQIEKNGRQYTCIQLPREARGIL